MPTGMVVLTPGSTYDLPVPCLHTTADPADPDWVARTSLEIAPPAGSGPLLLVFSGTSCIQAPYIGFAQRAARRAVSGYVLIDPVLPRPGAVTDWPDAPVTVIVTPDADEDIRSAALGARLRGWEVLEGDPHTHLREIVERP